MDFDKSVEKLHGLYVLAKKQYDESLERINYPRKQLEGIVEMGFKNYLENSNFVGIKGFKAEYCVDTKMFKIKIKILTLLNGATMYDTKETSDACPHETLYELLKEESNKELNEFKEMFYVSSFIPPENNCKRNCVEKIREKFKK